MGSIAEAKTFGAVGSLLILFSLVPTIGILLSIVGTVLVLVAVKYISDAAGDKSIFNNMIISLIVGIVGLVIAVGIAIATILPMIPMLMGLSSSDASAFIPSMMSIIWPLLLAIVIFWVFMIVSTIFLKKSYDSIADKTGINTFRTAALLYLIGAALLIVIVGIFIIFVAEILQIVAFFSIDEKKKYGTARRGRK